MLGSMLYGFVFAYVTSFGQAFLLGTFILLPVKERSSGAKHCQLISGVLPSVYWLTMFSTDLATFVLPSLGVVGVVVAFDVEPFAHAHNVWWVDDHHHHHHHHFICPIIQQYTHLHGYGLEEQDSKVR